MLRGSIEDLRDELLAESMRTATLVGLASIPVGFVWIYVFGTGNASYDLLIGAIVGIVYSHRSTPAHRAGARAGLFVPIPGMIVQTSTLVSAFWGFAASVAVQIAVIGLASLLVLLLLWVVGALFCIAGAFCSAVVTQAVRQRLLPWARSNV